MIGSTILRAAALAAALLLASAAPAWAQNTVRPEVGKPLQAAESLFKAKKYREALAKVAEADAVAGKTPYETYVIQRTKGSIAAAAGDNETAAKAFEAVIASGQVKGPEQLKMVQAVAGPLLPREGLREGRAVGHALPEGGRHRPGDAHARGPVVLPA